MKVEKKVSINGDWAKVGQDIVDEGMITILDEGKEVDGDYGKRIVFAVKTVNGNKIMGINQSSLNNLVDAFGDDTKSWAGQMVKTYVVKQKVGEKLRSVAYLCGVDWDMLEDWTFAKSNKKKPMGNDPIEDDEIPNFEM